MNTTLENFDGTSTGYEVLGVATVERDPTTNKPRIVVTTKPANKNFPPTSQNSQVLSVVDQVVALENEILKEFAAANDRILDESANAKRTSQPK